ncbi:MAG: hypothetical protein GY869_08605, partial [Planctomycetes bacterium]|nr:hypothetical protein [Planctomycetota bacterium]
MSWIFHSNNSNNDILKESYSIPAAATSIKINLTYYFIDSWDSSDEGAWVGVSTSASNASPTIVWHERYWGDAAVNKDVTGSSWGDELMEMEAEFDAADFAGSTLWLFVGAELNSGLSDEHFAIDNVYIWYR